MVHPDVVLRNVLTGFGGGLRDGQVDLGWNALVKTFGEPDFGPLAAGPGGPLFQTFVERGEGEVQENGEGKLVVEEIVEEVGGRIVAGEDFVEREHRAQVEIGLLIKLAANFVHVAIELFEHALEAIEHGVESGLVAREIGANEFLEHGCIAIFRAPELGYLVKTAVEPRLLLSTVLRGQFVLQFDGRGIHPGWCCRGCLGRGGSVLHQNLL